MRWNFSGSPRAVLPLRAHPELRSRYLELDRNGPFWREQAAQKAAKKKLDVQPKEGQLRGTLGGSEPREKEPTNGGTDVRMVGK